MNVCVSNEEPGAAGARLRSAKSSRYFGGVLLVTVLILGLSGPAAHAARPNPGLWYGSAVTFGVKRGGNGFRVVRFRTNYSLGCPSAASGGFHLHRVSRVSFRVGREGRFAGSRRFPLKGSDRHFRVKVSGRFTRRRKARGVITWYFPGCTPTPRRWGATGPRRYPNGNGDDVNDGVCIWIPLPDGSGFICV
jgi:hypothetical protein